MTQGGAAWWESAFRRRYLSVYAHRSDDAAQAEVRFAAAAMGLAPGARVLDAACGAARHVRALAAAGFDVVGLDWSADLLSEAMRRSPGLRLVRGDLRALPFRDGTFAGVTSFFTSFGYFDEEGDRAQLREVRRVLRAGGRHLLDFLNAPHVAATLVPASERVADGATVRERREIRDGRVRKTVTVGAGGPSWEESVRLWSRAEVGEMLVAAGLRPVAAYGDLAGGAWSPEAPRLVVVSEAA